MVPEADECGFYEIYSQFLNHECEISQKFCIKKTWAEFCDPL
jgi:hypothetical protein